MRRKNAFFGGVGRGESVISDRWEQRFQCSSFSSLSFLNSKGMRKRFYDHLYLKEVEIEDLAVIH